MRRKHQDWRRVLTALAAAAALGACSTEPEDAEELLLDDAALLAADATLEDVTLWSQPFGAMPAQSPAQSPARSGASYDPGEPGGQRGFFGALSGTRSVTFYDEDGNEQEAYDALLTASIHFEHEIEGEVSRGAWTATVHRERDKTVSGLLGEETERTWNGTGSEEVTHSVHLDDGVERSYEASGTVAYEDVVVPIPGADPRWPLSGTVRRTMTVTRTGPDGSTTRTLELVITFDGTSTALLTVNGEEREIDLSARAGINPLRRRRNG